MFVVVVKHFNLFVCVYTCTCHSIHGDQRISYGSWFSFSNPWVPGIKLRSLGLLGSALTHAALFLFLEYLLFELRMVVSHNVGAEN